MTLDYILYTLYIFTMLKYFVSNKPKPSRSGYEFQMLYTFEKRKAEAERMKSKYPNYIPTIIERSDDSHIDDLDKSKYLFNPDVQLSHILIMIRKKIKIKESESIILFVDNRVVPLITSTINELYKNYANKDGFLYITYSTEKTFG